MTSNILSKLPNKTTLQASLNPPNQSGRRNWVRVRGAVGKPDGHFLLWVESFQLREAEPRSSYFSKNSLAGYFFSSGSLINHTTLPRSRFALLGAPWSLLLSPRSPSGGAPGFREGGQSSGGGGPAHVCRSGNGRIPEIWRASKAGRMPLQRKQLSADRTLGVFTGVLWLQKASHQIKRMSLQPDLACASEGVSTEPWVLPTATGHAQEHRPQWVLGRAAQYTACLFPCRQWNGPYSLHCSIMGHELKYIINILHRLIYCWDKKPILWTNGEKFHNNNEEFLSAHTNLPQINNSRLIVPSRSELRHEPMYSLLGS